jgi:carotenoid 1,2-hydratase
VIDALPELPETPGAYRWIYADFTRGDTTAVFIFMVGSLFSPRYAVRGLRGARPVEHSAVNFALYRGGVRRTWVLSEYPTASLQAGRVLRIGRSSLALGEDGAVHLSVDDRTAPWGQPVQASLVVRPGAPHGAPLRLLAGHPHFWQPLAPLASGTLTLDGEAVEGRVYLDTNHGDVPLGLGLDGWRWSRLHQDGATHVAYQVDGAAEQLQVEASPGRLTVARAPALQAGVTRSGWGLALPTQIGAGGRLQPAGRLIESSPFYARLEAGEGGHALTEVADFARFRSPLIRWMAHFRTRVERAA